LDCSFSCVSDLDWTDFNNPGLWTPYFVNLKTYIWKLGTFSVGE
jgi:hypothetical protein